MTKENKNVDHYGNDDDDNNHEVNHDVDDHNVVFVVDVVNVDDDDASE